MLAPCLLVSQLLAASAQLGYQAGLRTEGTIRSSRTAGQDGARTELQLLPMAAVQAHTRAGDYGARYSPSLFYTPAEDTRRLDVEHAGQLTARIPMRPSGHQLTLTATGSYGARDFSGLVTPVSDAAAELLTDYTPAIDRRLRYGRFDGSAVLQLALLERLSSSVLLGGTVSGGLDAEARASLPRQAGPRLGIDARYLLGPRDSLASSLGIEDSHFSTGQRGTVIGLQESWSRELSRTANLSLGLGAAASRSQPAEDAAASWRLSPRLQGGLGKRFGGPTHILTTQLSAQLAPYLDPFTADIYQRAELTGTATWTLRRDLTVSALLGATRSFFTPAAQREGSERAGLQAHVRVHPDIGLEAGAHAALQRHPSVPGELTQWRAYVSVAFMNQGIL